MKADFECCRCFRTISAARRIDFARAAGSFSRGLGAVSANPGFENWRFRAVPGMDKAFGLMIGEKLDFES